MHFIGVFYRFPCNGQGEVFTWKEAIWGKEWSSKITVGFLNGLMRLLQLTALLEMLDKIIKRKIKFCASGYKLIKKIFPMNSCLVKYSKCKCMNMWVIVIFPSLGALWEQHLHPTSRHQGQEQQPWPARGQVKQSQAVLVVQRRRIPSALGSPSHWVTRCMCWGSASLLA